MSTLEGFLSAGTTRDLSAAILTVASASLKVRSRLPYSTGMTMGVNPSGERQAETDVFANDAFATALVSTGKVAEVASEEMAGVVRGPGQLHVAMDPLDGSSNISTNNPLGSIFGFYSAELPCSGQRMVAAAYVTYGPLLTITFSTGGEVCTFVAVEESGTTGFVHYESGIRIPEKPEVYGMGGLRKDWVEPVQKFVSSLEERGMKLRYGGTFVGDYNQVLRYGGIFGYPSLISKPKGKLRVLFEAAPMAYVTVRAGGAASDGAQELLLVAPSKLAETTPVYLGTKSLVRELDGLFSAARAESGTAPREGS